MKSIGELITDGSLAETAISILVVSAIVVLSITGKAIPDALGQITLVVIGYYFGSKQGTK